MLYKIVGPNVIILQGDDINIFAAIKILYRLVK